MTFEISQDWFMPLLGVAGVLGYVLLGAVSARLAALMAGLSKENYNPKSEDHNCFLVMSFLFWPVALTIVGLVIVSRFLRYVILPSGKKREKEE